MAEHASNAERGAGQRAFHECAPRVVLVGAEGPAQGEPVPCVEGPRRRVGVLRSGFEHEVCHAPRPGIRNQRIHQTVRKPRPPVLRQDMHGFDLAPPVVEQVERDHAHRRFAVPPGPERGDPCKRVGPKAEDRCGRRIGLAVRKMRIDQRADTFRPQTAGADVDGHRCFSMKIRPSVAS